MRINAYILAADPTWIEASVLSYYKVVDTIIVSYDFSKRGWTGAPIPVDDCIERLRRIDQRQKIRLVPGAYSRPDYSPMENDTYQRQSALLEASKGADWVLQLDTDEVLPCTDALVHMLQYAEMHNLPAVEWPMRVLFRQLRDHSYLEVCAVDGSDRFEYPGPIAVRPGVHLVDARRTDGRFLRPVVAGDAKSLEICRAPQSMEHRLEMAPTVDAILHNSWARSRSVVRNKIASWGHNSGWRSWFYYYTRWLPAAYVWRRMRNFHPFVSDLWPALKPCAALSSFRRIMDLQGNILT